MSHEPKTQLQMIWPQARMASPPTVTLPAGYSLRTYRPGDEPAFYNVMALAGWPGWDDAKLKPWIARILPESWFLAVHDDTSEIVATAMGLHDHSDLHPFGGELGWVAAHPSHTGRGLGRAVCAAVTARLIGAGYHDIHLYTEDERLPALKTYLTLGYVPFITAPDVDARWQAIIHTLNWPPGSSTH